MWLVSLVALAGPPGVDSTVLVEQGSAACSGVFVDSRGRVATAYHCVAPGGRPRITTRDGRYAIGRVRGTSRRHDLAVIEVSGFAGEPHVDIREEELAVGETTWVVGHPFGALPPGGFFAGTLRWSVSRGVLSAVGPVALQTTAPVNPGNSGGAVLDEQGRLIGIVSRRMGNDGLGFAGLASELGPLLDGDRRGLGPIGGTFAVELVVQANGTAALPISLGARAEAAFRDRLVLGGSVVGALGARWQAVDLGSSSHAPFEGRLALRQRIGRGPWTTRVDLYGAIAQIDRLVRDDGEVTVTRSSRAAPVVGGRVAIRNVALDYGMSVEETPFVRMQAVWRFPGTLLVF